MNRFGLSNKGFKRKRYIDVLEDMQNNAKSFFGQDINIETNSPLGIFLKVIAFSLGEVWQLAENVYYSAYKDTATGYQTDYIGQYIGIRRKPATYAKGIATFTGRPGTVIPANFIIAYNNVNFWTLQDNTIPSVGYIDVNIQSIELGNIGNVPAGKINRIVSALSGVESVINNLEVEGGREVETDTAFKKRYDESIASGGSSTTESIKAALLALEGVRDAKVSENDTLLEADGLPPKSVSVFIHGGSDNDVAKTIFATKGGGIQAFGENCMEVVDSNGVSHQIGFTRATEVDIYIKVILTRDEDLYPENGDTTIKTAIIDYIGGVDVDSKEYLGGGLGNDIVYTRIIGLCHKVQGVTDVSVEMSTDNLTFVSTNIIIAPDCVAQTNFEKVVIT